MDYTHDISELSDLNAECAVISTLIANPSFFEFEDCLQANHFFDPINGILFDAIRNIYLDGVQTIDAYNLEHELAGRADYHNLLEQKALTSTENLIDLYSAAVRGTKEEYLRMSECVLVYAFKRDMSKFLMQADRWLYRKKEESLAETDNYINSGIDELIKRYESTKDIELFGNKIDDLYAEIVSRRNADGTVGLPSKFECLRHFMSYEPAELVVISARMKKGKSIWMLNEAVDKLRRGVPVLYIETEMIDRSFLERMLAHITGIDCNSIKRGTYPPERERDVVDALNWIRKQPLYHIYDPSMTMEKLYSIARRLQRSDGIGFIIYDYMKCDGAETSTNYNLLGQMTNALKNNIAGNLGLPVLAGIQLNRNGEVADSDKISRYLSTLIQIDAKTAVMMDKDGPDCGNYFMKVALNRNGPCHDMMDEDDYIDLFFDGGKMRFSDCRQHNIEPDF